MTQVSVLPFVVLSLVTVPLAAAAPAPGRTTLIAPIGNVFGTTIAFSWQAVPQATGYLLQIHGVLTTNATDMQVWYTAEHAGCASGRSALPEPGTCTVMLTPPVVAAPYKWFVQTWSAGGFGPESEPYVFLIKDPVQNWGGRATVENERFSHAFGSAGGNAFVDNETGLIWTNPEIGTSNGIQALFVCQDKIVVSRRGFRLPTRDELETLIDTEESNPSLPAEHPFLLPSTLTFWTHTREVVLTNNATFTFVVDFSTGGSSTVPQTQLDQQHGVWCVRGPGGR